jgi:Derlin-2/3
MANVVCSRFSHRKFPSLRIANTSNDTALQIGTRPVGSVIFLHPLLAALTYVSSALAPPGAQTSLMGLVTIPVAYFPYVMVALDFLMAGPHRAAEAVAGLVVGHAWWWSVWGGSLGSRGVLAQYGQAPQWLRNFFGEGRRPRPPAGPRGNATGGAAAGLRASGIEVVPPRRVANAEQSEGHQWGVGNRLGS